MKVGSIFVTLMLGLGLSSCSPDGSGGCEQSKGTARWCYNFKDTADETGKQICTRVVGTFTEGSTCADLGYTVEQSNGSWTKP